MTRVTGTRLEVPPDHPRRDTNDEDAPADTRGIAVNDEDQDSCSNPQGPEQQIYC
jgi:hypothetical protein